MTETNEIKANYFETESAKPKERYFADSYFEKKQLDSLVNQIKLVHDLNPKTILEIGVGNGFVSDFLMKSGINVTTFDINSELAPDITGNLIEIDNFFNNDSFDLILCAEVLEHIPFIYFDDILRKLKEITKNFVIVTLPRRHRIILDLQLFLKIPFFKPFNLNLFYRIPDRQKWEGHYWEIDFNKEFSQKTITRIISKHFIIDENYIDNKVRHHQIFILRKEQVEQ